MKCLRILHMAPFRLDGIKLICLLGDVTETSAENTSRQWHKFNSNDFAKSTYIAEIETRQEKMRKLITHVSFVH